MSQIVDLNSTFNKDSFIDFLLNDVDLDNARGAERIIDNTFGTWIEDKETTSISSGTVDLIYDESSFYVNFSVIGQVKTHTNLTFDTVLNGSIRVQFDAWGYLASNSDLINAIGLNKNAAINHYVNHGHYESRKTDTFDKWKYLASNGDLIQAFGSDTTAATRHYISNGYKEGRYE